MSDADAGTVGIEIQVNGEARRLSQACSIAALVQELGLGERRIAVAVNREVVPRSHFAGHRLAPGDRVEILQAVGGG